MNLSMNEEKIQSISSYAVSSIVFPWIDTNSLKQWVQQQHMM